MAADDSRYDGLFFNAAQQCGGIDPLFSAFFGFLHRKTDFYVGCKTKQDAEKVMMSSFNKYWEMSQEKRDKQERENKKRDAEMAAKRLVKERKDKEEWEAKEAAKKSKGKKEENSTGGCSFEEVDDDVPVGVVVEEVTDDKENSDPSKSSSKNNNKKEKLLVDDESEDSSKPTEKPKPQSPEEEDTGPAPEGNGGKVESDKHCYTWTQTLQTCDMFIPIKPGTLSRELKVEIKADSLKVSLFEIVRWRIDLVWFETLRGSEFVNWNRILRC